VRFSHLTVEARIAIHVEVLAAHDGSAGVGEEAVLESAMTPPQAMMMGETLFTDPLEIAAAYLFYSRPPFANLANGDEARRSKSIAPVPEPTQIPHRAVRLFDFVEKPGSFSFEWRLLRDLGMLLLPYSEAGLAVSEKSCLQVKLEERLRHRVCSSPAKPCVERMRQRIIVDHTLSATRALRCDQHVGSERCCFPVSPADANHRPQIIAELALAQRSNISWGYGQETPVNGVCCRPGVVHVQRCPLTRRKIAAVGFQPRFRDDIIEDAPGSEREYGWVTLGWRVFNCSRGRVAVKKTAITDEQ
jgi:hypothetical protein